MGGSTRRGLQIATSDRPTCSVLMKTLGSLLIVWPGCRQGDLTLSWKPPYCVILAQLTLPLLSTGSLLHHPLSAGLLGNLNLPCWLQTQLMIHRTVSPVPALFPGRERREEGPDICRMPGSNAHGQLRSGLMGRAVQGASQSPSRPRPLLSKPPVTGHPFLHGMPL